MSGLSIDEETVGDVVVMTPSGRIDSTTAKAFEAAALAKISAGATHMVFDFQTLDYISSAGLRVVLLSGKRLKAAGGALLICNMQSAIRDVFEISGFLSLFAVCDSRAEAISAAEA